MTETSNTSRFTSDYISTPILSEVMADDRTPLRDPPSSPSISATIDSFIHVIPELYDLPSNISLNAQSNVNPENLEAHGSPKNRPILKWNALCVQALLYPIAVVTYLLIGAAAFNGMEYEHEKMARQVAANQEMHAVNELQQAIETVLSRFNLSENISEEILGNFTLLCADYSGETQNIPYQWEFLPAFYFSATIITTIGYGRMSPSTGLGRAFVCVYAIMGIPLLLVCLVRIGKYLSHLLDTIISHIPYKKSVMSKYKDVYSIGILIVIAFVIVILMPAVIFEEVETQWSYEDAVYFAIVSLTTIGFGDLTPSAQHLREPKYIVLYLTWLFVGFAIVSVLVTKLSGVYIRVNKSVIMFSKRCFNKCFN